MRLSDKYIFMKEWYYSELGQTKGPVSKQKLIDKVLKEELELDSYVTDGIDKPWKKVKDFPNLMEELHKPADLHHTEVFPDWVTQSGNSRSRGNLFWHIPIRRFVIMSLITGGLYQLYWFYKQWHWWATHHKQGYKSFDREAMRLFFVLSLLEKIETDKALNEVEKADFNGTQLFWTWTGVGIFAWAGYSLFKSSNWSGWIVSLAIYSLDFLFLLPVQRYINRVNAKLGNSYDRPSFGHYLCLAASLGPLLLLLLLFPLLKLITH